MLALKPVSCLRGSRGHRTACETAGLALTAMVRRSAPATAAPLMSQYIKFGIPLQTYRAGRRRAVGARHAGPYVRLRPEHPQIWLGVCEAER